MYDRSPGAIGAVQCGTRSESPAGRGAADGCRDHGRGAPQSRSRRLDRRNRASDYGGPTGHGRHDHVLLVGPPATRFAQHCQLEQLPKARSPRRSSGRSPRASTAAAQTIRLYRAMLKSKRTQKDRHGTVGAVALDRSGTVAAGASTGGIDSMLPGRVGDSPLIGCGVYADNQSGAVSMTGMGEGIIRLVIAKSICDRLAMGKSPAVAARQVLRMLVSRIRGSAGALVLSPDGRFAIRHVTPHMAAGWWNGTGQPTVRGQFP